MSMSETTAATNPSLQTSERRCENPECNVNKLISMVPKRKTTQFISEPVVMDKPMLVNGFTAVFQVDGSSAKLMDIKNPNGEGQSKSIYRIVPNSHVHVVNYVVVDTDETYLRKITENDPGTMQKLLSSQKESADQMLKKIMSGQGSSATAAMTTVVSTINTGSSNLAPQQVNSNTPPTSTNVAQTPTQPASLTAPKASIKLPVRMHPNLKITAVACAESVNPPTMTPNAISPAPATSYITPIPITSLQSPSGVVQPSNTLSSIHNSSTSSADTVDKPTYDKMQAEINDLRRTVAMLAEAQAKNQQPQVGIPAKPGKRPRVSLPKKI